MLIKDRDLFKQKLNTTCSTTVNFLWYNKRLKRSQGGLLTAQEEDFEKPTTTTHVCKCCLSTSSVIVTIKIDIPLPHGAPGCQRHNSQSIYLCCIPEALCMVSLGVRMTC